MVGFDEKSEQNKHRQIIRKGIPILEGQDLTKGMILDIMGHHLAHIFLMDLAFGSDFCGPVFAGMCVINQCLLVQNHINPTDIIEKAYRLLQK